jgi:hypothetical protein
MVPWFTITTLKKESRITIVRKIKNSSIKNSFYYLNFYSQCLNKLGKKCCKTYNCKNLLK